MNIKNIYLLALCAIFFLASCGNEFVTEDNYDLTSLGGYVAFDAPGNTITNEDIVTDEDTGGTQSLTVECPTGTLSDITIDFEFSGDAVFGTDFTVEGASASGGSIVLSPNANDVLNRDNVDIDVVILSDEEVDGNKTLTVTLVSASNADGEILVGRGGTDLLTSRTIIIGDNDCVSDLAGTYTAVTTYTAHDFLDDYPTNTMDLVVTEEGDGVYSVTDISGGLYSTGPYVDAYGTTGFAFTFSEKCGDINWTDQADPFGQNVEMVDGSPNVVDADGVISITVFLPTYFESWTIVMTPQ